MLFALFSIEECARNILGPKLAWNKQESPIRKPDHVAQVDSTRHPGLADASPRELLGRDNITTIRVKN
jgi:hypothetical protein